MSDHLTTLEDVKNAIGIEDQNDLRVNDHIRTCIAHASNAIRKHCGDVTVHSPNVVFATTRLAQHLYDHNLFCKDIKEWPHQVRGLLEPYINPTTEILAGPVFRAKYKKRIPDPGICTITKIDWREQTVSMSNGRISYFPSFDEIEIVR